MQHDHKSQNIGFRIAMWVIACLAVLTIVRMIAPSVENPPLAGIEGPETGDRIFDVQSIDTMKDSRDNAMAELTDSSYDSTIRTEIQLIKATGANYVAIDTPYDQQFLPVLTRWVNIARQYGLSVWFRGNFSGWEGWFNYPKIDEAQHNSMLGDFIRGNPSLFQNGDMFSPCPECENGGSGDPRQTGASSGFNSFLRQEYGTSEAAFSEIGKNVRIVDSMNSDIAKDVIDSQTAAQLGTGLAVDHYVATPQEFISDIESLSATFGHPIAIGEFGAPIPGLQSDMSEQGQVSYIDSMLSGLYSQKDRSPIVNYWTLENSSTALINTDGSQRQAYTVVSNYFNPFIVSGTVTDTAGHGLGGVLVSVPQTGYQRQTNSSGYYRVFVPRNLSQLTFAKSGYQDQTVTIDTSTTTSSQTITLQKSQ